MQVSLLSVYAVVCVSVMWLVVLYLLYVKDVC